MICELLFSSWVNEKQDEGKRQQEKIKAQLPVGCIKQKGDYCATSVLNVIKNAAIKAKINKRVYIPYNLQNINNKTSR